MSFSDTSNQDSTFWSAIRERNIAGIREHLDAGASVNSQCPEDSSTALHLAVESGCASTLALVINHNPDYGLVNVRNETATELALRLNRKDIAEQIIDAKQCEDFYLAMKQGSMDTLDLLIESREHRSKKNLGKAWRRLEIENMHMPPEMEDFVHLKILQHECEAVSARKEGPEMSAIARESLMETLMNGIDRLVEKQEQSGNLCHDVDEEFLEITRDILKLLHGIQRIEYFPLEKLKFCLAIYLAIHDRKPYFNMYHLLINKIMIVDFLKQFRSAHQNSSKILDNRMTKELFLSLNNIFVENSHLNCNRILELWAPYLESRNRSKLYRKREQIMIHSYFRKSSIKETLPGFGMDNITINEPEAALVVSNNINNMFVSIRINRKFKTLSKTFFNLKDLYSLTKMIHHLNTLENIRSNTEHSSYVKILAILRVMQVIGETLQSTTETPNISTKLQSSLLESTRDRVLGSIVSMQNFLLPEFTAQKYSLYKEAYGSKIETLLRLLLQCADGLLELKQPLKTAYGRTIGKCLKAFLERLVQSDSTKLIHSQCKLFDLQSTSRDYLNLNVYLPVERKEKHNGFYEEFLQTTVDDLFLSCIKLLRIIDDLDELKRITKFHLRLLSCHFAARYGKNFDIELLRTSLRQLSTGIEFSLDKYFSSQPMQCPEVLTSGNANMDDEQLLTGDYLRNETKRQIFELKVFDDEQLLQFVDQLSPFWRNVVNIDEKYRIFEAVCTSNNLPVDVENVTHVLREKDMADLNAVFNQLLQEMGNIMSVGNAMTEVEIASMISSLTNSDIEQAAIEKIMLDVLRIINERKVLPEHPLPLITSARPVISRQFLRDYLTHDGLIYDAICRNARNPRISILLNGICMFRDLKVDLVNHPEQHPNLQRDETQVIDFISIAGRYSKQSSPSSTDKYDEINFFVDCLDQLSPDEVKSFCMQNEVSEERWQEMILHAISSKNETSARKLIEHFALCKMELPIACFLMEAVTKRMPNLVQRICELDPDNVDYANCDQQTALYRAVEVGCTESMQILLRFKVNVFREPYSPALRALELRRDDMFDTLTSSFGLAYGNLDFLVEVTGRAVLYNRSDLLERYFFLLVEDSLELPLSLAIQNNNLESIAAILDMQPTLIASDEYMNACSTQTVEVVQLFVHRGADCNLGILCALFYDNQPVFRFLLHKEKINQETKGKLFPYCMALRKHQLARDVLEADCPMSRVIDKVNWDGMKAWLPKMWQRKPKVINQLDGYVLGLAILDGMDKFVKKVFNKENLSEHDHGRLLNCAIRMRNVKMLKYLLEHGCNVNHTDVSGLTPLGTALSLENVISGDENEAYLRNINKAEQKRKRRLEIIEIVHTLLEKGANVNKYSYKLVAKSDPWTSRNHTLKKNAGNSEAPISIAACQDHNELVEMLLSEDASIDNKDSFDKTALIRCIESGLIAMTDKLIRFGANLNYVKGYVYPEGGSILHYIVQHHHFKMYKYLVENYEFDESVTDIKENTILHIAIFYQNLEIVEYFRDNDVFWVVPNEDGHTPLQLALHRFDVVSHINESLFNVIKTRPDFVEEIKLFHASKGKTLLHIAACDSTMSTECFDSLIKDCEITVNCIDTNGRTAFHYALLRENLRRSRILHDAGATLFPAGVDRDQTFSDLASILASRTDIVSLLVQDQNTTDTLKKCFSGGNNLLQLAILQNNYSLCELLLNAAGFDPTVLDREGNSTLHLAASVNSVRLASLLLSKNLNIDATNNAGLTPVRVALETDRNKVANYLRLKGAFMDIAAPDNGQAQCIVEITHNGEPETSEVDYELD